MGREGGRENVIVYFTWKRGYKSALLTKFSDLWQLLYRGTDNNTDTPININNTGL